RVVLFSFSSRRRHTRCYRDWSSDVCSSDLTFPPPEQSSLLENAPNARGADRHDVGVQHHERQSPIAFQGFQVKADDGLLFPRLQIGRASCRERVWEGVLGGWLNEDIE